MTLEDRVDRLLSAFRFTPRQARFVALVALMSGYCLRRQYARFIGVPARAKSPAQFLERLVVQRLATKARPAAHRAFLYHLKARPLYDALHLSHDRNRRVGTVTRRPRRLMLVDFALDHPDVRWYAAEADKVALFADELGIPSTLFPRRTYHGADHTSTTRPFIHKLPIYRPAQEPTLHFVVLGLDTTGHALASFFDDHADLLRELAAWRLVVVYPRAFSHAVPVWRQTVQRVAFLEPPTLTSDLIRDLHAYFCVRHALTGAAHQTVTVDEPYQRRHARFARSPFQALYPWWRQLGGPSRSLDAPPDLSRWRPTGGLLFHPLPYSYDLFGHFPGVA